MAKKLSLQDIYELVDSLILDDLLSLQIFVNNKVDSDKTKEHTTDGGIVAVTTSLKQGQVVCVSKFLEGLYNIGDTVLFPESAGTEHFYNGEPHLFLNGNEQPQGDVWAIL